MRFRDHAGTYSKIMREEISNQVNISNQTRKPVSTLIPCNSQKSTTYFSQQLNSPTLSIMCTSKTIYWVKYLKICPDTIKVCCCPTPISSFLELIRNGSCNASKNTQQFISKKSHTRLQIFQA
jgi:hypothetical protein